MAREKLDLLPGTLDVLVLKSLTIGPLHGYAIARAIQARAGDELALEEGTLYPALHRMERRGWISAEWGPSESNRRAKFYRLTRAGRAQLERGVEQWNRLAGAMSRALGAEA